MSNSYNINQITRKKVALIAVASFLLGSSGCVKKEHEPNEKRGTNYTYDFADFLNIQAYGPDGEGVIEVSQKDYTAKDFAAEAEYIKVRKIMDRLNMVYILGEDNSNSQAVISQKDNLHNGDIVTLSLNPKAKYDLGDISLNLEPYEYRVTELTEGKSIDLFADDIVIFYGLDGTNIVGAYSIADTSSLPEEIAENIMYTAELSSKSETNMRENGTVIIAKAAMDQDFLNKYNYHNIDIYMKKHGYRYMSEIETTLDLVLKPFEFDAALRSETEAALAEYFCGKTAVTYNETYVIDSIGNIQQLMNAKGEKKFEYTVTLHSTSEKGNEQALQSTVTVLDLAGRIVISSAAEPLYTEMSKLTEPINAAYAVMAQYYFDGEQGSTKYPSKNDEQEG